MSDAMDKDEQCYSCHYYERSYSVAPCNECSRVFSGQLKNWYIPEKETVMNDNIKEFRKSSRHDWIEQLDKVGADPLIIIAVSEEGGMVVINKSDDTMKAVGLLEMAKMQMVLREEIEE